MCDITCPIVFAESRMIDLISRSLFSLSLPSRPAIECPVKRQEQERLVHDANKYLMLVSRMKGMGRMTKGSEKRKLIQYMILF